jgi:hypothetical protein
VNLAECLVYLVKIVKNIGANLLPLLQKCKRNELEAMLYMVVNCFLRRKNNKMFSYHSNNHITLELENKTWGKNLIDFNKIFLFSRVYRERMREDLGILRAESFFLFPPLRYLDTGFYSGCMVKSAQWRARMKQARVRQRY